MRKVSKYYAGEDTVSMGFSRIDLNLDIGEFVAITGESGSGKSTLLNVISGLDTYEEGEMFVCGEDTTAYGTEDYEHYRKTYIGNIFQDFNLINSYTVYQNIEVVMLLSGRKKRECKQRILELLELVGLSEYRRTKVSRLSGGQKQRVAIARALAKDAPIIVADEPTGNPDIVMETLSKISDDKLVIIVTHNYEQAEPYVTRKITMHDGKIIEDKHVASRAGALAYDDLADYAEETTATDDVERVGRVERAAANKGNRVVRKETPKPRKMRKFSELRLGLRNTFNLPAKFLLLFIVYFCFWVILFSYAQNTKSCDIDSLDLEEAYLDSAFTADEAGDYLSAIEYTEKCLMLSRDTARIIDDSPMFSEYKFLVEFYAKAGMWVKALRMQKRRTDYWKNMFQCSADNEYAYFMMFRRWAQLLSLSGANKSAIREVHQFIDETNISKMYLDGITEDLADYYFNINDYQNALKYYEKSGSKYGVAKSSAALGDYLKAIALLKKQIENDKGGYITISLDIEQRNGPYDTWLCDLASYYNQLGQYDSALAYERKHRNMSRFELAKSYFNQGIAYVGKMQLDSAICYLLKAEEIYRIQHQSKQHAFVLAKLLSCYLHTGEYDKIEYYIDELIKSASNDLLSSFSDLTYNERSKYIELYSRLLGEQIPMYMYYVPTDKLEALAYDALLLIRGALLNSENNLRRVINERHDASLNKIWEELKADRYILSKEIEKDSLSRKLNVDSLKKVIYLSEVN